MLLHTGSLALTPRPGEMSGPALRRRAARRWGRGLAWAVALAALAAAATLEGVRRFRLEVIATQPVVTGVNIEPVLFPSEAITVLVAAGHEHAEWPTTVRAVTESPDMWRRLHLMEWNSVPAAVRERALDNMVAQYHDVLLNPRRWDTMTMHDWDVIPQPIRTAAYRHMVAYWAGYYLIGDEYDLPPRLVADTLAAIVMSESWFEHRAHFVNADGNQDIGLAQASDYARVRMRELYAAGRVDVELSDEDYLNPWRGTQFAAIWLRLMLDEARGDLDTAVRAYHRGIRAAADRRGTVYLETVNQRLTRYIRNQDAPIAWDDLWRRADEVARVYWPWLAVPRG